MHGCTDKTRRRIFFACAWINAVFAIMRFLPSSCQIEMDKSGDVKSRYKLSVAQEYTLAQKLDNAAKSTKIIVAWDWSKIAEAPADEVKLDKACGSCIVVNNNNSKLSDRNAAAVVFNDKTMKLRSKPPSSIRRRDQLYVWHSNESPAFIKRTALLNNFRFQDFVRFNATMTLRRDSDVVLARGQAIESYRQATRTLEKEFGGNLKNMIKSKSKIAVAVLSNCRTYRGPYSRRKILERFAETGLKIDKFGSCFNNALPSEDFEVFRPYKFYLALEGSFHCKDYITEEFFTNGLSRGMVPVVWGARKEDYEAVAPPHSFIHVENYKSAEELVDYLTHLDKNDDEYMDYFRWYNLLEQDMPNYGQTTGFCQLCRVVHGINVDDIYKPGFDPENPPRPLFTDGIAPRTVDSADELIFGREEADCLK